MKKTIQRIAEVLAVLSFTLIIIFDFFPELGIGRWVAMAGFILAAFLATITREKGASVFNSSKGELAFTIFIGLYLIGLLFLLSALGGESQVGLEWTNPIVWMLYVAGVFLAFTKYKKSIKEGLSE